jgi:small-conductance mechanosensitive channel
METFNRFINYTFFEYQGFNLSVFSLLALVLLFLVCRFFLKGFRLFLHRQFSKTELIDEGKEYTINQLVTYIVTVLGVFIGIKTIGIDISILLGASAALLVGIGLGLQDVFRDFIAGLVLLFEGVFKVGDLIDYEGAVARVRQIDLRTSKIETRDGTIIIVPNSKLVSSHIINWTHNGKATRFKIVVGVAYGSDTALVKKLLIKAGRGHKKTVGNRDVLVRFEDFADSALVFEMYFWTVDPWDIEVTKSDLRFEIDRLFRENNVTIPFPQRDVHMIQAK